MYERFRLIERRHRCAVLIPQSVDFIQSQQLRTTLNTKIFESLADGLGVLERVRMRKVHNVEQEIGDRKSTRLNSSHG